MSVSFEYKHLHIDAVLAATLHLCRENIVGTVSINNISVIGSVVEYNVANVVARVRFPDDALFFDSTCMVLCVIAVNASYCYIARWRSGSALGS